MHRPSPQHTQSHLLKLGIEDVIIRDPTCVLVVNGNNMFCAIIAASIARDFPGFVVASECSVEGARKRLEKERFHLVVTDIYLSDLPPNGIARLVAEKQPRAALLVITPHACFEHKKDAEQILGFVGFLLMPFGKEISQFVREALELRNERENATDD